MVCGDDDDDDGDDDDDDDDGDDDDSGDDDDDDDDDDDETRTLFSAGSSPEFSPWVSPGIFKQLGRPGYILLLVQ